jgi:hypothetical protein
MILLKQTEETQRKTLPNDAGVRMVPMVEFVNDLRIKLKVDRRIYNIVFGNNKVNQIKTIGASEKDVGSEEEDGQIISEDQSFGKFKSETTKGNQSFKKSQKGGEISPRKQKQ